MKSMNGLLLSAGLGTRLRPFTETTPKPAIPFLSVPLATYSLALFENHKIHNLVVNTHHLPEKIESLFSKIHWPCDQLIFSPEKKQILGSGGGIRQALPSLLGKENFFVANADEVILPYHQFVIKDALDFHRYHKGIATILTNKHPEVGKKFGGLWLDDNAESSQENTKVKCFSKTPISNCKGLHFVGIMILNDRIENYFFSDATKEENILYDTLTKAMSMGEDVHAFNIDAEWFETGNPEDFLAATKKCKNALLIPNRPRWADHLDQVINLHGGWKDIITE